MAWVRCCSLGMEKLSLGGGGALRLKGSRYGRMALASYQVVAKLET